MPLSKRTRFEVFKRDGFACQYCGRTPPAVILHVDHITPRKEGGKDDALNLITACADCNLGKAAVPLGQVHRPLADQIAEAKERQEQVDAYNTFLNKQRMAEEEVITVLGIYWYDLMGGDGHYVFGPGRISSVRVFLKHLVPRELFDFMDITEGRRIRGTPKNDESRWRYFCGCCWQTIKRRQQQAPADPADVLRRRHGEDA